MHTISENPNLKFRTFELAELCKTEIRTLPEIVRTLAKIRKNRILNIIFSSKSEPQTHSNPPKIPNFLTAFAYYLFEQILFYNTSAIFLSSDSTYLHIHFIHRNFCLIEFYSWCIIQLGYDASPQIRNHSTTPFI